MKKKNYLIPVKIFVLVLLLSGGCQKAEPGAPTPPYSTPSIIASVSNGVSSGSWVSLSNRASASIDSGSFNLSGVAWDSTLISITIAADVEVGINYSLNPFSAGVGA